jgi:hypothetical protein
MSTTKRILGDYNIETIDSSGSPANEVTVTTEIFRVKGDLVVTGDTTSVSETNLNVSNNTILLNEGETGAGVTAGEAALVVDRGTENNAQLRWNETTDQWEISADGLTFQVIQSSSGSGTGLENVVEDTTPQLGGSLDVNSQQIVSTSNGDIVLSPDGTGTVKVESAELALDRLTADPTAQADYNLLYHKTEDAGGTGLYFKTSTTSDELVSKSKAIVFSIIF